MTFEPLKTRKAFDEFLLNSMLGLSHQSDRPMGNVAQSKVGDVVKAWLVGLDKEVDCVLPRLLDWIDQAIASDENFGTSRNFHRLTLNWARGLGQWMLNGTSAPNAWEIVRQCSDAALMGRDSFADSSTATEWLDDHMAFCYLAGQYEVGIAEFEQRWGPQTLSLDDSVEPRELGYAYCLHKSNGRFSKDELDRAAHKMLKSKLESDWLGRGQVIRAATWLKLVYDLLDPQLTALQIIQRAYDDMPNVSRPDFLA